MACSTVIVLTRFAKLSDANIIDNSIAFSTRLKPAVSAHITPWRRERTVSLVVPWELFVIEVLLRVTVLKSEDLPVLAFPVMHVCAKRAAPSCSMLETSDFNSWALNLELVPNCDCASNFTISL